MKVKGVYIFFFLYGINQLRGMESEKALISTMLCARDCSLRCRQTTKYTQYVAHDKAYGFIIAMKPLDGDIIVTYIMRDQSGCYKAEKGECHDFDLLESWYKEKKSKSVSECGEQG